MEYPVHFVLEAHALTHDLCAPRDLATQRLRRVVWNPHFREEAAGVQLREHSGVDLVRLHPGFRNEPHLRRIRHDHAGHPRAYRINDGHRVAGRLQHHMVGGTQLRRCPLGEGGVEQRDASSWCHAPVLDVRDLRDGTR